MSYAGLVADTNHPQPGGKQFLDQIIFFIVERGAAEMSHRGRLHERLTFARLMERTIAGVPHAVGDHLHSSVEINVLPLVGVGSTILDLAQTPTVRVQFVRVGAFRTKVSTR